MNHKHLASCDHEFGCRQLTLVMSMNAVLFLGAPWGGEEDLFTWGPSSCSRHHQETENTKGYAQITCPLLRTYRLHETKRIERLKALLQFYLHKYMFAHCSLQASPFKQEEVFLTWFSVAAELGLGILLPAVTMGFFPLGKGMAGSLMPSKQTVIVGFAL